METRYDRDPVPLVNISHGLLVDQRGELCILSGCQCVRMKDG